MRAPFYRQTFYLIFMFLLTIGLLLASCQAGTIPAPTQTSGPPTSSATASATLAPPPTATFTPTFDPERPWGNYPAPQLTPVTPVPGPLTGLVVPDEVQVLVLAGTDRNSPYVGRTDAVLLAVYHPRLAKMSLISLPPDWMVYIPGYTMQRLQISYAVTGVRGLMNTVEYNTGFKINRFALIHLDDFVNFINDIGGLDVTVLTDNPKQCGGIPSGTLAMTGDQVLCYIRYRDEADEASRSRRQQQVVRQILLKMVQGGNLARLPELFDKYHSLVESDLGLMDLVNYVPFALKLGDPHRIAYFTLGPNELDVWKVPNEVRGTVFLAKRDAVLDVFQNAVNFVLKPEPLSDVVLTLQHQLTTSPTPWPTPLPSATGTKTLIPSATSSVVPTPTLTPTITNTPTITLTPTITPTCPSGPCPTPTASPTGPTLTPSFTPTGPTHTPSDTPTPTETPTETVTPTP